VCALYLLSVLLSGRLPGGHPGKLGVCFLFLFLPSFLFFFLFFSVYLFFFLSIFFFLFVSVWRSVCVVCLSTAFLLTKNCNPCLRLCVPRQLTSALCCSSQLLNKEAAMRLLRAKLFEMKQEEQNAQIYKFRKDQVGTGGRSEKIKTYNYKDSRVTDHRLGQNFALDEVLKKGKIDGMVDACLVEEQKAKLEELMEDQTAVTT